jgi:hypothetical protein
MVQPECQRNFPVSGQGLLAEQIERWCAGCDGFVQWERDNILRGNPPAELREEHRTALKLLLRLTRLFSAALSHPDSQDRAFERMLGDALWKLEQSWRMIYEPLPDSEAEKLMAEVFPG